MKEVKMFTCKSCGRERPDDEHNCGGDCVYCVAECGDPDAIKYLEFERRENGGFLGIDAVAICTLVENGPPSCPSVQEECDVCSRGVWVSLGTKNDAEEEAKKEGSKVFYLCMPCVPGALLDSTASMGPEQIEELKAAGIDLNDWAAKEGVTVDELAKMIIKRAQEKEKNESGCKRRWMD